MKFLKIFFIVLVLFEISLGADIVFNEKQKNYLSLKKQINLCVDPSWKPFEYIEDNQYKGIIADIFKEFQKKLPIPIVLVETKTWQESLENIKNSKCDILASAAETYERKKYLSFTKPYLVFPNVLVTKDNEIFIENFKDVIHKKIGVVENYAVKNLLKSKYPSINLIDVQSVEEGLYKVNSGEIFGFIDTSATVIYNLSKNGMTNLKIASKVGIDYLSTIAIRKQEYMLYGIFNTIIEKFDEKKLKQIKENWLHIKVESVVDYKIVYQVVFVAIFIILLILFWNRTLKKEIKERKKAQKNLDKFVQVIEQTPISVMITDVEGNIEYINPFVSQKTGYSKKELIGKNPRVFKSGLQDSSFYQKLWSDITAGKMWQGEFQNKKKNGEIFWESAIVAPIYDKKGKIAYFTSIKDDITEKLKEKEELKIAKKEAEEANRAKSDFLAKMSHEIRTPMNAVLGMVYLLEQTKVSSVQENYIKKAKHAAKSLLGLINDILDFSKIEAGKFNIQVNEFNFNEMISNVLSVMSIKAEEKGLELLAHYDQEVPAIIQTDSLRVEQILTNLLSNAIKFTKEGEVVLSIKLKELGKSSAVIQFCVQDTGIGISKENLSKLFEEFSQVDNTQTRNFQGTGLGLAISKKLANLLGGDIWCEDSKKDIGSTFCFSIKCQVPKEKIITSNRYEIVKKLENLKCLVVDDNTNAIEVLEQMLLALGYTVVSATNGKDAIRLVNENQFDLIFLDYKMEGLSGIETFSVIKDLVKANNTKTIMVTAFSKDVIDEDIEAKELDGYLSKPISPSSLYDKIVEVYYQKDKPKINKNITNTKKVFRGIRVLLVEDNELNRDFATEVLNSWHMVIDIAVDGVEAIRKIKSKNYDVVLMDIQMPHMDGLEATKIIREMSSDYFKQIPIIAVSANALMGDREKSLDAGMQEHITKPLNPNILFEVLVQYLEDKIDTSAEDNTNEQIDAVCDEEDCLINVNTSIFDINDAMSRINNNKKVYLKILKQFREKYKSFYNELIDTLKQKDLEVAHVKIHELKGISANISATILFDTLKLIDLDLKQNNLPDEKILQNLNSELERVFKNIDELDLEEVASVKFDRKQVIKLLDEIRDNLEIDIVRTESYLENLIPYLKEDYQEFEENLSNAINQFDTNNAKILIDEFKKDVLDG